MINNFDILAIMGMEEPTEFGKKKGKREEHEKQEKNL